MQRALVWSLRVAWAALPLVAGPTFAAALEDTSRAVQVTASVELWVGWAAGLLLTLVPTPLALTLLRTLAPAAPVAAAVAFVDRPDAGAGLSAGLALVAAGIAFSAEIGQRFVQGGAYGDEVRFPLRPPGPLVLGPLEILWIATVGGLGVGPLLLAAEAWVAGGLVLLLGVVLAVPVLRRFHGLTRRWLVLVPAGIVVHDHLVLVESVLVSRRHLAACSLALADTEALDLTAAALGPAVDLRFAEPQTLVVAGASRARSARVVRADAVLVSPSRPGATLTALHRHLAGVRR